MMGTLHKHLRTLPQLSVLSGHCSDANVPTASLGRQLLMRFLLQLLVR